MVRVEQVCIDCQVNNAYRLLPKLQVNGIGENELKNKIWKAAEKHLESDVPLYLAKDVFGCLLNHTNISEYFGSLKKFTNQQVINFLDKNLDNGKDDLLERIRHSILGNLIDYGIPGHVEKDIEKELENIHLYSFGVNHFDFLLKDLSHAKKLVYLADNCGEIIFDLEVINFFRKNYPALDITLVVRSKEILNDMTLEDMKQINYTGNIVGTGTGLPGVTLREASEDFKKLLDSADLIISKGQGNFEGLYDSAPHRIYFIFVVKCVYIADMLGVQKGDMMLLLNKRHQSN